MLGFFKALILNYSFYYFFMGFSIFSLGPLGKILLITCFILVGFFMLISFEKREVDYPLEKLSLKDLKAKELLWLFGLAISLGMILGAFPYFINMPENIPQRRATSIETFPLVFIHVLSGTIWLISGFLQFSGYFLERLRRHRINGYIYLVSALVSTLSLLLINLILNERSPMRDGPVTNSLFSVISLLAGFYFIKKRNLRLHREWMLRSMLYPLMMPLDRMQWGGLFFVSFKPVSISYFFLPLILLFELILQEKLDFSLLPAKSQGTRTFMRTFFYFICLGGLILTMCSEYVFVTNPIFEK